MFFILTYVLSFFILFSIFKLLFLKSPVHSVFHLILVFFNLALILLIFNIDFLAMILLIVYVGAIAILFLFVIMILNIKLFETTKKYKLFSFILLCLIFLTFSIDSWDVVYHSTNHLMLENVPTTNSNEVFINYELVSNLEKIGFVLYTYFFLMPILASVILLLAMVGAIVISLEKRTKYKTQNIADQILREPVIFRKKQLHNYNN